MEQKSLVTLLYVASGLVLAILPIAWRLAPALGSAVLSRDREETIPFALCGLALVGAVSGSPNLWLLVACAVLAGGFHAANVTRAPAALASAAAGILLGSTLLWWRRPPSGLQLSPLEALVFTGLAGSLTWIITNERTRSSEAGDRRWGGIATTYLAAAAWICFTTFAIEQGSGALTAWHHWGAYIGPAELLLSGAHLFTDFPAQYGMGPTLLVASFCGSDCWQGFYTLAGAGAFLYAALLGWLMVCLVGGRVSRRLQAVLAALMFCCALLWTSAPSGLANPLQTPSTTGLRFVPALLVALCAWHVLAGKARAVWVLGHVTWLLGVWWAPESAFYCTFVWWPTVAMHAVYTGQRPVHRTLGLVTVSLSSMLMLAIAAFATAGRLAYGEWPDPQAVFAYVQHPPGPLPVSLTGAFLFTLSVFMLGTAHLIGWMGDRSAGDGAVVRRRGLASAYIPLLLAFATWSYFLLGRSHDNNVLNISPFLLLVLTVVLVDAKREDWRLGATALASSFVAWLVVFNFSAWESALSGRRLFDIRPTEAISRFSFDDPQMRSVLSQSYASALGDPADLQALLSLARKQAPDPYSVITTAMTLPRSTPTEAWNGLEAAETYAFLPIELRTEYLRRTAARLHRCGWLVIDRSYLDGYQGYPSKVEWLASYEAVYAPDRQLQFGAYLGFHLVPKGQSDCRPRPQR